ncbi:hypothetical protein NX794_03580 [Streptomyces sp. LP11]|uniref:Integral membrane protein n=1 Tax=Streptomyces pyxinicus TaxID=2970331 RepID=A0ABT2AWP9_9ACTN|nr:hypothetical protein [Streptomyces sp. LP11]MCS0600315.1 hypothetical protein [Streptomyces sp. LP11]
MVNEQVEDAQGRVTEGTWGMPLLVLVPAALIRILTGLSTPWLMAAWVLWGLAALLAVVGWVQVVRYGPRNASGWSTCLPLHCVLVWLGAQLVVASS